MTFHYPNERADIYEVNMMLTTKQGSQIDEI